MTEAFAAAAGLAAAYAVWTALATPWKTVRAGALRRAIRRLPDIAPAGAMGWAGWQATRSPGAAAALGIFGLLVRSIARDRRAGREALARDREVQALVSVTAAALTVHPAAAQALRQASHGAPAWLRRGITAALGYHAAGMPLRAALEAWAAQAGRRDLALYARLVAEAHETSSAAADSLRRLAGALRRRCELLAERRAELAGQRMLLAAAWLAPPAVFAGFLAGFPWAREWYQATLLGKAVSAAGAAGWLATVVLAWRPAGREEE